MAFPTPTANAIHVENDTCYVARNGRWEQYNSPDAFGYGPTDVANRAQKFNGHNWSYAYTDGGQHRASNLIRYKAAFVPNTDCNPMFGMYSRSLGRWVNPKTDISNWDGMVHWGGGGLGSGDYNSSSFDNDAFILNLSDNSTRLCKAHRIQFVDVTFSRLGANDSMMFIRMYQLVKDGPFFVQSIARGHVNSSIADIHSMFVKVSAGTFEYGHASMETF